MDQGTMTAIGIFLAGQLTGALIWAVRIQERLSRLEQQIGPLEQMARDVHELKISIARIEERLVTLFSNLER